MTVQPSVNVTLAFPDDWQTRGEAETFELATGLAAVGVVSGDAVAPPGSMVVGSFSYYEPHGDDEPPDLAALVVATRAMTAQERVDPPWGIDQQEGVVVVSPAYSVREERIHWLDAGEVVILHNCYQIPTPTGDVLVLDFSTPNLLRRDDMQSMFGLIVSSVQFVDQFGVDRPSPEQGPLDDA